MDTAKDRPVECKACGREFFPSESIEDEVGGPEILGNTVVYECPHCGAKASYGGDVARLAD